MRSPSCGVASWLLAPPGDDRRIERGDRVGGQDRAQRARADHVGLEPEQRVGRHDGAIGLRGERLRAAGVDVGDRQARAFRRGEAGDAARDAARALERDVKPGQAVLAQARGGPRP